MAPSISNSSSTEPDLSSAHAEVYTFDGKTWVACLMCDWGHGRIWKVRNNALTKLAEHMFQAHRIRIFLSH